MTRHGKIFSLVHLGFITPTRLSVLSFFPGLCKKSTEGNLKKSYIMNGNIVSLSTTCVTEITHVKNKNHSTFGI